MGYMGLDSFGCSDMAFDLAHEVIDKMAEVLNEGLKNTANEYNTSGPINVSLFFEAFIIPVQEEYVGNEAIGELAKKTMKLLKEKRKAYSVIKFETLEERRNQNYHIKA